MTSYIWCNLIVINLANVIRILNLVSKLKVLTKSFPKMYRLLIFIKIAESHNYLCFLHCEDLLNMCMSRDKC